MDGYATGMIARGPTFADDGETPTGSVHLTAGRYAAVEVHDRAFGGRR